MKTILSLLLCFIFNSAIAQCDTTLSQPRRVVFDMKMDTKYFDYYNSDGVILWKRQLYDSTLIPPGGFALRITTNKVVEGYAIFKVVNIYTCKEELFQAFDLNMKELNGTVKYYEYKR